MVAKRIKRGDIYRIALDPTVGKEIKKTRRCVVISNNQQNYYSPLIVVIPTTSDMEKLYSWEVVFQSEGKPRKILTDQIYTVDKSRLARKMGFLSEEQLKSLAIGLRVVLELKNCKG